MAKHFVVKLTAADGSLLRIEATPIKGSTNARSSAVHSTARGVDKKRVHARGATKIHADLAAAEVEAQRLVEAAVKIGWTKPVKAGEKPDAFTADNLPKPGSAPKANGPAKK